MLQIFPVDIQGESMGSLEGRHQFAVKTAVFETAQNAPLCSSHSNSDTVTLGHDVKAHLYFAPYLNIPQDNCRLSVKSGSPGNRNVQKTSCLWVLLGTCTGGKVLCWKGFHSSHRCTCQSSQKYIHILKSFMLCLPCSANLG